jgi:hypothetical protein
MSCLSRPSGEASELVLVSRGIQIHRGSERYGAALAGHYEKDPWVYNRLPEPVLQAKDNNFQPVVPQ